MFFSLFSSPEEGLRPFVFESNQHQRYEDGIMVGDAQNCVRTVSVLRNTDGCSGYRLRTGDGYIVKLFNNDINRPQMADKPMRIVKRTDNKVVLRGYPVLAQTPFGWQEIDLSDYGLVVEYEDGIVCKCTLCMYDRNIELEYRKI